MITTSSIQIPMAEVGEPSVLPIFKETPEHKAPPLKPGIPKEYLEGFGDYTGKRVLPYTMQNHYTRERTLQDIKIIVYENNLMRATFLPQYGGRLYSLFDKTLNRELLSVNPVFQPANLANRNAWFSGGVEWNLGRCGHSFLTCEDVYFARVIGGGAGANTDVDGKTGTPPKVGGSNHKNDEALEDHEFLRLYAFERQTKLFYHIDFYLPPDNPVLVTKAYVYNIYDTPAPLYYWANTAVPQGGARVFSSSQEVLYLDPRGANGSGDGSYQSSAFGFDTMPYLGSANFDASYPENFTYSSEFFYQTSKSHPSPWEAVAYKDGVLFYEYSSQPLRTRKMFCWGVHEGGNRWQEFLSTPDAEPYVEVQAGIHPTQCHTKPMAANSMLSWLQVFGGVGAMDPVKLYGDFHTAQKYVNTVMDIRAGELQKYEKHMQHAHQSSVSEILHHGTPWGHIEIQRLTKEGVVSKETIRQKLNAFTFTKEGPSDRSEYFLKLLDGTYVPTDLRHTPISYTADLAWDSYFEKAIKQTLDDYDADSCEAVCVQRAVMLAEHAKFQEAESALLIVDWGEDNSSLYCAVRAGLYCAMGNQEKALLFYSYAVESYDAESNQLPHYKEDLYLTYGELLVSCGKYQELWDLLQESEPWHTEELRVLRGIAAFYLGKLDEAAKLFAHPLERIREGDNRVVDLWFSIEAAKQGVEDTPEFRGTLNPDKAIDFRMV